LTQTRVLALSDCRPIKRREFGYERVTQRDPFEL
jgi:hypothetical protein